MGYSTTKCVRCNQDNLEGTLTEIPLHRKGYDESIGVNTYITDWPYVGSRPCFLCHSCRHKMTREKILLPLLSIPMVIVVTWIVMRYWHLGGDWKLGLGIVEAFAVFWCFAGLSVLWNFCGCRFLMGREYYNDLLSIEALYPNLHEEFKGELIQWIDHFSVGDTLIYGEQLGKIFPKTRCESRSYKPKEQIKRDFNKPYVPADNEKPITYFAWSILLAAGMTVLIYTKLFPIVPEFLNAKDANGNQPILLGFAIMIPQILIIAVCYMASIGLLGYSIWLLYYRIKNK